MGSPQVINCTVSTVSGVESSLIMISWIGPGGVITATNGRVSTGSLTDDSNNMFSRSLQFTYLMEGDEGTYTCNVMILETGRSQLVELQSLISKFKICSQSEKFSRSHTISYQSLLLSTTILNDTLCTCTC